MTTKFNIWSIIHAHLRTLKRYGSEKYDWGDIGIFYGLPVIFAILLLRFRLTDNTVNVLITALSIFAGLLLNLLLLIFDTLRQQQHENNEKPRQELLKQTYSNISYSILLSLMIIIILLGFAIWDLGNFANWIVWLRRIASWAVYFLVTNFILTLMMVLKRVHALMFIEFK